MNVGEDSIMNMINKCYFVKSLKHYFGKNDFPQIFREGLDSLSTSVSLWAGAISELLFPCKDRSSDMDPELF